MKNKIIAVLIGLFSLTACSQQPKTELKNPDMTNNKLTADNYVETMLREIKHYPQEPYYYIYIENSLCIYEILINDVPMVKNFEYGEYATPFYINDAILRSGTQKITYRLYPAPPEYNGENGDKFSKNTSFAIEVFVNDKAKKLPLGEEKLIKRENAARNTVMLGKDKDIKEEWFVAEGKEYYEASFTFDAKVPYEIEGWSKGQDLKKFDQKELQKAVVNFYKTQWNVYNAKEKDAMFSYLYKREKEINQSKYESEEILKKMVKEYSLPFDNSTFQVEPLENYKMVLYGDGKIVALIHTSIDSRLRGESMIWGKYKSDMGNTKASFRDYLLYLPEGKKLEDGLEVIR